MGVRYLKDGQGFGTMSFPSEFGFSGSAQGRHDPRPHPVQKNDEYGDHLARGGQPQGNPPGPQRPARNAPIPLDTAASAARGAYVIGAQHGAKAAAQRLGKVMLQQNPGLAHDQMPGAGQGPSLAGPGGPPMTPPPPQGALTQGVPQAAPQAAAQLAKGGKFIQKGIRHPGRMTELAKEHGVSLGEEIAKDQHSKDPSLRAAANLGARFRSGDLHHPKKRKG